jgi:transporter family protein
VNRSLLGKGTSALWVVYAFGAAFFGGVTAILAKCGIQRTDSTVATAIRTAIVLIFSWLMVLLVGTQNTIGRIGRTTWIFLILSGIATGASWLCYFRALQLGDVNKVVCVDKCSTVLTILLALIFFKEEVSLLKVAGILGIAVGTYLMIQKQNTDIAATKNSGKWLLYAVLSAIFASLTAILGKVGISGVESNLGTAIRTIVVFFMAWFMVFLTGKRKAIQTVPKHEFVFICLSGVATGASWLCYYRALQLGPASLVVPIDKLSILVTIGFSYVAFHERLCKKAAVGLTLIIAGTLLMLVPAYVNI